MLNNFVYLYLLCQELCWYDVDIPISKPQTMFETKSINPQILAIIQIFNIINPLMKTYLGLICSITNECLPLSDSEVLSWKPQATPLIPTHLTPLAHPTPWASKQKQNVCKVLGACDKAFIILSTMSDNKIQS